VRLLVQVVDVANELDRVDDLLVVQQHTSDLASVVAVVLLDNGVDGVSDLLSADLWLVLQGLELGNVDQGLLLLGTHELGGGTHAWVLVLLAVARHATWSSVVLSVATMITTSVVLAAATATAVLLVAATATAVVLVATATSSLVSSVSTASSLVLVLSALVAASVVVVAWATVVLLLSHVALHLLTSWSALSLHVEVFHEVLLDLLEASLLAFSVEFGAWDPELDTQGSCTEWC